jgi:hypothetical protein
MLILKHSDVTCISKEAILPAQKDPPGTTCEKEQTDTAEMQEQPIIVRRSRAAQAVVMTWTSTTLLSASLFVKLAAVIDATNSAIRLSISLREAGPHCCFCCCCFINKCAA